MTLGTHHFRIALEALRYSWTHLFGQFLCRLFWQLLWELRPGPALSISVGEVLNY